MKRLGRVVGLAIAVLILVAPARAAAERITNFDSQIQVQPSGRVEVTETINYDFGYASRHGIYRFIPTEYKDDQGNIYRPTVGFDGAQIDGGYVPVKTSTEGNNLVFRLGDSNKTITGLHTYVIQYHFDSLLVAKDGDLLRFDVTGDQWKVPIGAVTARVSGPAGSKLVCYTGVAGSTARNCTITGTTIQAGTVNPGENVTLEALWPAGTVTNLLQPYKTPGWVVALFLGALMYVLAGLVLLAAAVLRWLGIRLAERRARLDQTIIAQYEPPADLTPGEIGLLTDNKASLVEVTATLIQAAVAGVIRIEQVRAKSTFKAAEYQLHKLKAFSSLPAEERPLLEALFGGADSINLKDVNRQTVPAAISAYQSSLRSQLKAKSFYTKQSKFSSAATAAGFVFLLVLVFTPLIFVAGILLLPLAIFAYKRAGQIPRRTPQGLKTWAEVEGFKLFLSVTEKDRLAFTDAPKRTPKQFSQFLPFAIALGVEQEWAKQFEGIDVTKSAGWYDGHGRAFTAGYLAGSLHDSFAPVVASSSRAPSSSSSGGFGGGSSGGGFGGGGGGSW